MEIEKNLFKRAIKDNKKQNRSPGRDLANHMSMEILKDLGFDWILIDMEHYPNEVPLLAGQLQANGGTATPIVRPPWNDPVWVKRFGPRRVQFVVSNDTICRRSGASCIIYALSS